MGHDDSEGIREEMSLKAVLAEDDPDIQLVARLSLKRAGFQVIVANDGAEALAKVGSEKPDVALLDWMMPELDGIEVCRRLTKAFWRGLLCEAGQLGKERRQPQR